MIIYLFLQSLIEAFKNRYPAAARRSMIISVFTTFFLFTANRLSAQTIVETFEEAPWTNVATGTGLTTTSVVMTNTAAPTTSTLGTAGVYWGSALVTQTTTATAMPTSITLTSWSAPTNTIGFTTTGQTSTGTFTWAYSNVSIVTSGTSFSRNHSISHSIVMPSQNSYLITPTISAGIASITFWLNATGGMDNPVYIGMKTNTTSLPLYPTNAGFGGAGTTQTGGAFIQFSLNSISLNSLSLSCTTYAPGQITYTVPTSLGSVPAQFAFVSNGGHGQPLIDDIVIIPYLTITLGSNPSVCYSPNSQTANLTYSATTGSPTLYSINGWSGGSFSNITNVALPASPIPITVPAATLPATYTATLTITNGAAINTYPISVTVNALPPIATVPSGVAYYYKFSGNANDTTGTNNGTLQNGPTSITDRYGNATSAYSFNGTNQYVSTANAYTNPGAFTISAWFNTSVSANGVLVGFDSHSDGSAGGSFDRYLWMNAGKINFFAGAGSLTTAATYNDGNWHMATGSVDPTDGMKLYIDGVLLLSDPSTTSGQNYTGHWVIGAVNAFYFNGSLDDITIYNSELTASQVTTLYSGTSSNTPVCAGSALNLTETTISGATYSWTGPNSFTSSSQNPSITKAVLANAGTYNVTVTGSGGCTSTGSNLVTIKGVPQLATVPSGATSYYNFSGNANDTTGANNGTLQNAPTSIADRFGNASSAYTFNGSTQYVSTTTSYTEPSTFTVSAWFNTSTSNAGIIMGFANTQTGGPANYDHDLYVYNGKVGFGIWIGSMDTINSTSTYNDGNWHLAAASLSPTNGMKLYVDGALVASTSYTAPQSYSGYWRIGDGNIWFGSSFFTGSIDDATIYQTTELTASQVSTLYSGTGSNSIVCPGSTLSLTETTISGATYLWSGTGTFSASTATQNPTVTSPATGTYSITVTGSNGCTSTGGTVVTVGSTYVWAGTTNTDWSTATNWQCGSVPPSASNITIPSVTNLPVLSANTTVNNITINSGATLGLNGKTFTINGTASGTGTYTGSSTSSMSFGASSTGTVYFTGGSNTIQNLTLTDGANITIGNALNIASTGTVTVGSATGATLASGGNITLVSDDNGSARIAQVPVNGSGLSQSTISGSVNVQCYVHSTSSAVGTARRAWRLLTAPVTNNGMGTATTIYNSWQNGGVFTSGVGTMITAPPAVATGGSGNGMDAGINSNYSMYTWNVTTQKLVATSNTKTTNISSTNASAANIGYFIFVRGDRTPNTINLPWAATINNTTLSTTGILQLGDQAFTSASGALSATINGLSVVSNPYACSIDFSELAGDKTGYATSYLSNITNRYYVWNSNLTGTQGVGGYVCIDDAANTKTYTKSLGGGGSASAADLSIQSGEAFFIMTTATAPSSITFKELTKNATNNFIYRPSEEQASGLTGASFRATLSLLNSDSTTNLTDGVVAQFNNAYCNCVDYIDAPKFNNVDEMFSLAREGKQLCIERRADIHTNDTLFFNLKQMSQHAYRFNLYTTMADHPGLGARLEDKYTGTKTPLNIDGSNAVDFTIDGSTASKDTARFIVVFGAVNIAPAYTSLTAAKAGNTIPVQWSLSNDQQMKGYALQKSTDGINYTTVYTTTASHTGAGYNWIDTDPFIGTNYYRVLSTNALNEESISAIVSVTIVSLEPSGITVYPNPVQNGQVEIAMNEMIAGEYSYRLFNDFGQVVQNGKFTHVGGNATYKIPLIKTITKGTYRLEIFSPGNSGTALISVVIE
jgi:hypothetical protein